MDFSSNFPVINFVSQSLYIQIDVYHTRDWCEMHLLEPTYQPRQWLPQTLKIGMQKKYNGFPANSLLYAEYAKQLLNPTELQMQNYHW